MENVLERCSSFSEKSDSSYYDCCDSPDMIQVDSEIICRNCGVSYGYAYQDHQEKRIYSREDINNRKTAEPILPFYVGNRTFFDVQECDSESCTKFQRLYRINNTKSAFERSFIIVNMLISKIRQDIDRNIPSHIIVDIQRIMKELLKRGIAKGRTLSGLTACTMYYILRKNGMPIQIEELENYTEKKLLLKYLRVCYSLLYQNGIKNPMISPDAYIEDFGLKLKCPKDNIEFAKKMYAYLKMTGNRQISKNPKGIASACIYMSAVLSKYNLTQSRICEVSKVSEVTLRNRFKDLYPIINKYNIVFPSSA